MVQRETGSQGGVDYGKLDPFKKLAQARAFETGGNLARFGMKEVTASRGESAFVWDEGDSYKAMVIEGLGTKNLVADELRALRKTADDAREITGRTHYDSVAQCTAAMIYNDLITVGADPQVITAYYAVGSSDWFLDWQRASDLVEGWTRAANLAGAVWGGGETPELRGIVESHTIELAGSAVGIIKPKERLTLGDKLTPGDGILLVESSGIHANGLTDAREVGAQLPQGYATLLPDGKTYGESLLVPTHIYAGLIRNLFEAGIDIHYMVNITGHGWRKLMRATRDLSYIMDKAPTAHSVFDFIQEQKSYDNKKMYGTFNMGAGFAIMMPESQTARASEIAKENYGFAAQNSGHVESGPKRVVITAKNVVFNSEKLDLR